MITKMGEIARCSIECTAGNDHFFLSNILTAPGTRNGIYRQFKCEKYNIANLVSKNVYAD